MDELKNQDCMLCNKPSMALSENEMDVPYFGKVFIFTMHCEECGFHKSDVESAEEKEPCKYTVQINSSDDMMIRIVKSSDATVEWPELKIKVEPGINAEGFVSNVEKLLDDVYSILKLEKDTEDEDKAKKKKLWKLMDTILDIKEGKTSTTLVISD